MAGCLDYFLVLVFATTLIGAPFCLVRLGEENGDFINVYVKFAKSKNGLFEPWYI